jgi:hypothetical protein
MRVLAESLRLYVINRDDCDDVLESLVCEPCFHDALVREGDMVRAAPVAIVAISSVCVLPSWPGASAMRYASRPWTVNRSKLRRMSVKSKYDSLARSPARRAYAITVYEAHDE